MSELENETTAPVKRAAKKTTAKKAAVKTAAKKVVAKKAAKKSPKKTAEKTTAKKVAAKKTIRKTPAKKTVVKKTLKKETFTDSGEETGVAELPETKRKAPSTVAVAPTEKQRFRVSLPAGIAGGVLAITMLASAGLGFSGDGAIDVAQVIEARTATASGGDDANGGEEVTAEEPNIVNGIIVPPAITDVSNGGLRGSGKKSVPAPVPVVAGSAASTTESGETVSDPEAPASEAETPSEDQAEEVAAETTEAAVPAAESEEEVLPGAESVPAEAV